MQAKRVRLSRRLWPVVLLGLPLTADAHEWLMLPADSRLEFVARYTGLEMPGRFARFDVAFAFDPLAPDDARLNVAVDVTSVDMGGADVNQAVTGVAWLNVGAFPGAKFRSENVTMLAPGEYAATGTLELKGVRRCVTVPFTWQEEGARGSMIGELTLQRLDFGVGTGTWQATDEVAADVRVRFEVNFERGG